MNRYFFQFLFKKALKTYTDSSLIKKDIDRTFSYFNKCEEYRLILLEATVLL